MVKRNVMLYLDDELVNRLKNSGKNVSQLVNEYLAWLCSQVETDEKKRIKELETEIQELRLKERKLAQIKSLTKILEPYISYYKNKGAEYWKKNPQQEKRFFEESARKLGLTPQEIEGWVKGARGDRNEEREGN